jgi:aminoglycoside 2'-N-acetyltransferase I
MLTVRSLRTHEVAPAQLSEIRSLLDAAFLGDPDGEFGDDDWAHTIGGVHVVVQDDDLVVAHAAVVERIIDAGGVAFRTGYVEGVAALPGRRGQGLGTLAMKPITERIQAAEELGVLGTGAYRFYERLGWERWRGPSFVRRADGTVERTAEDDDGLMVLRTGPSTGLDLASPITCDDRPGDCW